MITNKWLIEYACAQVGKPYWNGTCGQKASKSLYNSNKSRLPGEYKWAYNSKEAGIKVHDCHGLIKAAFWCDSVDGGIAQYQRTMPDCDIPSTLNRCKPNVNTIPSTEQEIKAQIPAGAYVFTANLGHIGIYIGDGYVVEARGRAYGVQKDKLTNRTCFTRWGKDTQLINFEDIPTEKSKSDESGETDKEDVSIKYFYPSAYYSPTTGWSEAIK